MLMADCQPLRKPQKKLLSGSDVASTAAAAAAEAAQQIMQLRDEDNNSDISSSDKKIDDGEDSEQSKDEIIWRKIEEIFGKEEDINYRPKKRRYRSLVSLYKATKPMPLNYNYGKKLISINEEENLNTRGFRKAIINVV